MGRLRAISQSLSVPQFLLGTAALLGVCLIYYGFDKFGIVGGAAVAMIPLALCALWMSLRNPAVAMFGMFVANYFIMALARTLPEAPVGMILDALIFFNFAMITLQAIVKPVAWRNARSGLTAVATLWLIYCLLEAFNPEMVSVSGWFTAVRSVGFYFFAVVILTQIVLHEYKYLKTMLVVLSILTLTAVVKACIQKYVGFTASENYWLFVLGGHTTHIIRTGVRYFSFFSDAANFGGMMGFAMVVFSIAALYYRNRWMKFYMLVVAAAACYGMLISGTRSALAVPFVGYAVFILLSRNYRVILLGTLAVVSLFLFLNFTTIGNSSSIIRRARSAFDTEDASFQIRLQNQAKFRQLMKGKYFGAGIGHSGERGSKIAPEAPLSKVPTDSWFVMIWVETGPVGVALHVLILLYILGYGAYLVLFRLRDKQLRGFIAALISGTSGVVVMSYANEVLGQIPSGLILYTSMSFIFLAPRFDLEIAQANAAPAQTPNHETPSFGHIGQL